MSSQRQNSTITIYRGINSVASVPITARSLRRYVLMQDDYIQLSFSLPSAVHFAIGDFCNDELFGRFYIADEQMPKYNTKTGGYDYTVKMVKDYMLWRNWLNCLVAEGQRMESQWSLTDKLAIHAQQIADNVNILTGATTTPPQYEGALAYCTGYGIEITADTANEVKFLSYEGKDIIAAMNMIADAWACEWWVTDTPKTIDGTRYAKTIHFGKRENNNTPYDFTLGENVESMDISRDQQDYCNRIYAYGGTQNVPEDYDRKLEFTLDYALSGRYADTHRPLDPDMLAGTSSVTVQTFAVSSGTTTVQKTLLGRYTIGGSISSALESTNPGTIITTTASLTMTVGSVSVLLDTATVYGVAGVDNARSFSVTFVPTGNKTFESGGATIATLQNDVLTVNTSSSVKFSVVWGSVPNSSTSATSTITATPDESTASKTFHIIFGGNTYTATLNPDHSSDADARKRFSVTNAPNTFVAGAKYTIQESDLDILNLPLSYFTPLYDTGTLSKVGERRIHLPADLFPNRYYEADTHSDNTQVVERVVIFGDVYPKMSLRIDAVFTETKQERIDHTDGSVSWENWEQYRFTVTKEDGTEFLFRTKYLLDGSKLQGAFTAPSNAQQGGYMLGGMTFDLGFDDARQQYTIIRNEDFGAMLPNDIIKPQVGDTLFFTGWNPKALSVGLDMVGDAEAELAEKTEDYADALQEGQFTFNCKMMSGWLFDLYGNGNFLTSDGKNLVTSDGKNFVIGSGTDNYLLLGAGDKVEVFHDALPNGSKQSRIIGYEYKLDKPYDTPTYIVGETEAYSRLKQLEKQLTKLS